MTDTTAAPMRMMSGITSDLRELWKYRSLLRMLVVRDLKTRYRNSALGVMWSFLQPLGMMVVMTFAFGVINRGPANMEHYNVFILSGLLAWNFFSAAVVGGSGSIIANSSLVKKVYFPARSVTHLSDHLQHGEFPAGVAGVAACHGRIRASAASNNSAPAFCDCHSGHLHTRCRISSVDVECLLSRHTVHHRVGHAGLVFLTPIWYDISQVSPQIGLWVRRLNPMASLVNIYQDLMYWGRVTEFDFVLRTTLTAIAFLVIGYLIFHRYSPRFGEEV